MNVQGGALLVSMPSVSHAAEVRDEAVSVSVRPTRARKLLGKYKYVLCVVTHVTRLPCITSPKM